MTPRDLAREARAIGEPSIWVGLIATGSFIAALGGIWTMTPC